VGLDCYDWCCVAVVAEQVVVEQVGLDYWDCCCVAVVAEQVGLDCYDWCCCFAVVVELWFYKLVDHGWHQEHAVDAIFYVLQSLQFEATPQVYALHLKFLKEDTG